MNLKRLELLGFKSFAKKTVLDFESDVTAIVGPNGSGKSNVAEAFRWALGEQSLKSLRGKRGEDLIFNGSAGHPKLNHASVEVVFNNKERVFAIDFDEVAVSRHIYRDGTNEYFINGTKVRLKDVIELLSAVSLGVSSHHIISQGEADRILNANMFERREMIEDALGLKVFQYKKEESEKKLEKTRENIKEVESLRREIAPHLRFLRKQIEQVKKAEEMRAELISIYKEYFKREEEYLNNFRVVLAKEKGDPDAKLKAVDSEIVRLSAVLGSANTADPAKVTRLRELDANIYELRSKKNNLEREIGKLDALIEIKSVSEEKGPENRNIRINEKGERICIYCAQVVPRVVDEVREDEIKQAREKEVSEIRAKRDEVEKMIHSLHESESRVLAEQDLIRAEIESKKDEFRDSERALYELRAERSNLLSILNSVRAKEEKFNMEEGAFKMEQTEAVVLAGREAANFRDFVIPAETAGEPRVVQEERRRKIERIKIRLEDMGNSGEDVLKEYNEAEERDRFLEKEIGDLTRSAEDLEALMAELSEKVNTEFKKGVERINKQFNEFFMLMFGGGSAELTLVVPQKKKSVEETALGVAMPNEEAEEEGVDINVSLPRKKIKGLQMLSGGERALTSIALLFAVSQVNPPPFLILDETDAALDESNSKKYGDMLENLSKISQLIVVTHNRETMSRAGILYGVTMGADGVSRLLSIKFDEAVKIAK
ncbi:MAG TPA: AAA family ATPase [Candidatus Paceibacterota bacterium]|nr:AAA family ATPase [Candidatus Paceibacterota bacterium]